MRELWFESNGVRLFAVEEGAGQAVVMLHGSMADHRAVLPLVSPLSQRCRIVAPDLRGSGRSRFGGPLAFDQLADDLAELMDRLGVEKAVVGGVSSGSGVALRFALQYPERISHLVLVKPVHAGAECGYTDSQQAAFAAMDSVASRALDSGVQVLRELYTNLPSPTRERALEMLEGWDAASVVATSRFVASGTQPFISAADLQSLAVPTMLVRGDDTLHPSDVSDLYAGSIPGCITLPATSDVVVALGSLCERPDIS